MGRATSLAGSLVLPLSLLALLRPVEASPTECAPSTNGSTIAWWNSANGASPCAQFESLYRQCDSKFRMFDISSSINYVCEPDQRDSDFCCCSSISFTLFQACRSCQAGTLPNANSTLPDQLYTDYLHSCPARVITNSSLPSNLSSSGIASWAFRPVPANGAWDYSGALANATKEGVFRATPPPLELGEGGKAGVAVAAVVVVIGFLFILFKYILPSIKRSRARRRGDEDFEVNDTGYKSWYGVPSSGGKTGWRGSVAGYFAGATLANASSGGHGRRGQSPGGGSTAAAGAWNEMKDDPSASGGKEYNDVYPLSGSAAPFAEQSANPFIDPNQVSRPEGLDNPYPASYPRHHEGEQQLQRHQQQQQRDDQLEDIYGSYDDHDGYDVDAEGPALTHATDGWEEREGESDYDRQKRWEDEGRAGGGSSGHQRDQSFGGGGEHGDGMYPVAM